MVLDKFSGYLKYSIIIISSFILCETVLVNSSDFNQFSRDVNKTETDIDNVFFDFTSSFENYDSYKNQFDNFWNKLLRSRK